MTGIYYGGNDAEQILAHIYQLGQEIGDDVDSSGRVSAGFPDRARRYVEEVRKGAGQLGCDSFSITVSAPFVSASFTFETGKSRMGQ